jgi:hypothetical protein
VHRLSDQVLSSAHLRHTLRPPRDDHTPPTSTSTSKTFSTPSDDYLRSSRLINVVFCPHHTCEEWNCRRREGVCLTHMMTNPLVARSLLKKVMIRILCPTNNYITNYIKSVAHLTSTARSIMYEANSKFESAHDLLVRTIFSMLRSN